VEAHELAVLHAPGDALQGAARQAGGIAPAAVRELDRVLGLGVREECGGDDVAEVPAHRSRRELLEVLGEEPDGALQRLAAAAPLPEPLRSEEHTSELQSRENLV